MAVDDIAAALSAGAEEITFQVGPAEFELVHIPAGEFFMGSLFEEAGRQPNEGPLQRIKISKAFYLGRYAVTQAQYKVVMGANPSNFRGNSLAIDQIMYADALEFCRQLSQHAGVKVTLPTEAQWEYACRAGTQTRFYSGDSEDDLARVAWYAGNSSARVHEVGQKEPNAWGLYDMHGNVWEPTLDRLPSYATLADTDPVGMIDEREGIMRGGGRMHTPEYCRSASRLITSDMFGGMGIRIAINSDA